MKAEFSEWENAGKPRGFDLANYAAKRKKQVPFIREFGELSNGMGDKHIFIIMDFGVRIVGIEGMGMFTEK